MELTLRLDILRDSGQLSNYDEALKVAKDLEAILGEIPDSELDFIVMHVCTLV